MVYLTVSPGRSSFEPQANYQVCLCQVRERSGRGRGFVRVLITQRGGLGNVLRWKACVCVFVRCYDYAVTCRHRSLGSRHVDIVSNPMNDESCVMSSGMQLCG